MTPDPTLRADLMAFLAAGARKGKRVRLRTKDYRPMCGHFFPWAGLGLRDVADQCGADCESGQKYCFEHRQEYEEKRQEMARGKVWFHDDTLQILRAYRFLRRRANRVAA